jgi:hypothetical protein
LPPAQHQRRIDALRGDARAETGARRPAHIASPEAVPVTYRVS